MITAAQVRVLTAIIVNGIAPTRSHSTLSWCLRRLWVRRATVDEPGMYAVTSLGRSVLARAKEGLDASR